MGGRRETGAREAVTQRMSVVNLGGPGEVRPISEVRGATLSGGFGAPFRHRNCADRVDFETNVALTRASHPGLSDA